ncbi:unnamed protein product [Chrysoparadoxa australica]
MIGDTPGGLVLHAVYSLLALVWILIALALDAVKYVGLVAWALLAWIMTSFMTLSRVSPRPLFWSWHRIDLDDLEFPDNFLWGVATAAHQVEGGCTNNNWSKWETTKRDPPTIAHGQVAGDACDHWNRYKEDVQLIKQLGCATYRFSIEWSKVEPQQGVFDETAISHYHDIIDCLIDAGVMPMVTLLHFTHPLWLDEMGAFEKEENVAHFVTYAERMYDEYGSKVKYWCTLNEPEVCTANGYVIGVFPPGKLGALQQAGEVVRNLLRAHVAVYFAIKEKAASAQQESHVGIVKDLFQFHPNKWYNLLEHFLAWQCDLLFNGAIIEFLRTGRFHFWVPFAGRVYYRDKRAPSANDFVGLNYYSHYHVSISNLILNPELHEKLLARRREVMTDMPHCMYPEGLYSALKTMSKIGKPIIVTENGVADRLDTLRPLYIRSSSLAVLLRPNSSASQTRDGSNHDAAGVANACRRYLYSLSRAIKEGVPVLGYYHWSLLDNFEWCEGYEMKFGLYEVNFETQQRRMRDGAKVVMSALLPHGM